MHTLPKEDITMVSIISFDLDGAIMHQRFADTIWRSGLPKIYATKVNIPFETAQTLFMQWYDTIGSERREWYDLSYWISLFHLPITAEELLRSYIDTIQPYPDAIEVIRNLSKNYKLIISSGAMKEFIQIQLETTHLMKYFSQLFSSTSDTNMVKKDPRFYLTIADKLHVKPSEIVHVGDNEIYDYQTPKKAGFQAFYLNRDKTQKASYIVHSLHEFEGMLNQFIVDI